MPQTVLIIDDSNDIHVLLTARLKVEGLRLVHAYCGAEGIQKAADERPDLILLDVDMPDQSGFEVCSALKSEGPTVSIPVIFLTAQDGVFSKVEGFDLGAVDYITKPFDPAELRARVRSALRTKRLFDMLAERARIDGLTGLWNRRYFEDHLAEIYHPEVAPCGLLMIDIDHFKRVNDTYGHPFGDRIIQWVADAIAAAIEGKDSACRYGGEEFAVLLDGADDTRVLALAERLRAGVAALPPCAPGHRVSVSIGAGSTTSCRDLRAQDFVAVVDKALYAAKQGGRDRTVQAGE